MGAPLSSWVSTVEVIELQKSLLDTWNLLRPFLNTWTANDKYSLISKDKWMETIQMHLSQKQNNFSQFFSAFFQISIKFRTISKKDDRHRFFISEITDHEKRA